MTYPLKLMVNGVEHHLEISTSQTLLEVLRENLHLTGTKEGCGEGECGACTVLMDGEPVNTCLILAIEAEGKQVLTIEGLARKGDLHPLQKAFIEQGAIQCGFCTPGMILSAKGLLDRNPHPTVEDVIKGIAGNLCRCTGYQQIVDAVMAASREMGEDVLIRPEPEGSALGEERGDNG